MPLYSMPPKIQSDRHCNRHCHHQCQHVGTKSYFYIRWQFQYLLLWSKHTLQLSPVKVLVKCKEALQIIVSQNEGLKNCSVLHFTLLLTLPFSLPTQPPSPPFLNLPPLHQNCHLKRSFGCCLSTALLASSKAQYIGVQSRDLKYHYQYSTTPVPICSTVPCTNYS